MLHTCLGTIAPTELILKFLNSPIPQFINSLIPQFLNSSIPQFLNASVPQFLNSSIPQFLNSSVPQFLNSSIPQFLSSSVPQFLNFGVIPKNTSKLIPGIGRDKTERYSSLKRLLTAPLIENSALLHETVFSKEILLMKY